MSVRGKLYQGGRTHAREAMLVRTENGEFAATIGSGDETLPLGRMRNVTARVAGSDRFLHFHGGFAFSTDDHEGLDALLPKGQARRSRLLAFFERTRTGYALVLLILLLGLAVACLVFPAWFYEIITDLIHFEFIPLELDRDGGTWAFLLHVNHSGFSGDSVS